MSQAITKYTVFLASPGDLIEEREVVQKVVAEINRNEGNSEGFVIDLLKWETHSAPGVSESGIQEIINNDIGHYDLFLGMLWTRFGTPTEKSESGTEEEFKVAYQRFLKGEVNQILLYFKTATPRKLNEIDPDQLKKINEFKKPLPKKKKVLYWEFDSAENLQALLRAHLIKRLRGDNRSEVAKSREESSNDDLGLLDYMDEYEIYLRESTKALEVIGESTDRVGNEMNQKTSELTKLNSSANQSPRVVRKVLKEVAQSMLDYSKDLSGGAPLFYENFNAAIEFGTKYITTLKEFNSPNDINELTELKDSIEVMKFSTTESLESFKGFYESVEELPRIQKEVNLAKRETLTQLGDFIGKLEKCVELTNGFYIEVLNEINRARIEQNKEDS